MSDMIFSGLENHIDSAIYYRGKLFIEADKGPATRQKSYKPGHSRE